MNQLSRKQTNDYLIGLILLVLALAILAACTNSAAVDLANTDWQLTALHGDDLIPGTSITLSFSEDNVSGSGGCNHYEGSFELSDDSLALTDLFWTEMGCMEPAGVLEQETDYLLTLNAGGNLQLVDDRLEILNAGGEPVLVFNRVS